MTIQERIDEIKSLKKGQHWYIIKQNLNFVDLCFTAKILEDFINDNQGLNYESFFNQEINKYSFQSSLNSDTAHRMTADCHYVGLTKKTGKAYHQAELTDVFTSIKRKCNGDFSKTEMFIDIIINQIEKVYTTFDIDGEKLKKRKGFKIHPTLFLYKVLLELGDITGSYAVTIKEFKIFLGTAKNYNYYHSTVSLILESRKDKKFASQFDTIKNYFDDNRFNKLFENIPYLVNGLKIKDDYIDLVREKVHKYETNVNDNYFTVNNLISMSNNYSKLTQQKIYYGAPGTGKSYTVEKLTSKLPEEQVERIIFHPEYDYASFIGGYKPTMVLIGDKEEIQYKFVPQAFTNIYVKAHNNPAKDYYLIIEEINRGNCAEIFGDIFQLLDRNSNYKISPSKELKEYLEKSLTSTGIVNGKMILPSNFHILATMNTSDQSLFPMDSAFKRRWDWEYIPINYEEFYAEKEDNKSFNYFVEFSDKSTFKWIDFIKKVNTKIKSNDGLGMDKCIGNYFVKPIDDKITFSQFLNKAIFYLWNDVFKDETENDSIFKNKTTYEDFFPLKQGELLMMEILKDLEVNISENTNSNSEEE